jgi:hypothetical protein
MNNSEHALFVDTPQIRALWLSLANDGIIIGKRIHEAMEAPVHVDVIDNDRASGPQGGPRPIHLKPNITFTVQTVMNEKIDVAQLRKYPGQASPA